MTEYRAVVYDLDGTLVRLDVDWATVERELVSLLRGAGADSDGLVTWELLDAAEDAGVGEAAAEIIARHEREGATVAERLPLADDVAGETPTAVCSLNCEAACRIALENHGLLAHVEAVVGRDTVPARKPDPEPLLAAVRALDEEPHRVLFVGDSATDEATARRAGTGFRRV